VFVRSKTRKDRKAKGREGIMEGKEKKSSGMRMIKRKIFRPSIAYTRRYLEGDPKRIGKPSSFTTLKLHQMSISRFRIMEKKQDFLTTSKTKKKIQIGDNCCSFIIIMSQMVNFDLWNASNSNSLPNSVFLASNVNTFKWGQKHTLAFTKLHIKLKKIQPE